MIWELLIVVAAYLLGSLPSALLIVKMVTGVDIRTTGSGNIGATNAIRSAGFRVGLPVTVVDVSKGALLVWVMAQFNPASSWLAATMLAAIVGHCFPVWLRCRGGKGVATGFGAFMVLAPISTLAALGLWLVVLVISWRVSAASLVASAGFPVLLAVIDRPNPIIQGAVCLAAMLIILRHHSNIRMLIDGSEPRIGDPPGGDE